MKRVAGFVLICLCITPLAYPIVLETIDAVVNGELILSGETDYRIIEKAGQLNKLVFENNVYSLPTKDFVELHPKVLEQMIDELLLLQEVRGKFTSSELAFIREDTLRKTDLKMEEFRNKYKTAEEILLFQNKSKMSWEEIRQGFYQQIYNENIKKVVENRIINRRVDSPTQEEMDDYVKNNPDNRPDGSITIQQIQLNVPTNASPEEEQKIRLKAQEIALRAKGGDPFDYLIAFSEHEASRKEGGLLTFKKGELTKELDQVFDMNVGEISDPIRTPAGFHIVRVVYKDTLRARVFKFKQNQELNKWLADLRSKATIERRGSRKPSPIIPQ